MNVIESKLAFETMKTFYSLKLKQNGKGLLLIHVVHDTEALPSS